MISSARLWMLLHRRTHSIWRVHFNFSVTPSAILIFQMRNPLILMSASHWSGAIRKKFWMASTQKVTYECIVTNLPRDEFPAERMQTLYNAGWSIESSFRKLKYTIGLSNFHAYKPEYVKQEIWARLLAYNITETMINHTLLEKHGTKHEYKVNFTMAAHICRVFLRLSTEKDQ